MNRDHQVTIRPDGTVLFIYDDDLALALSELGPISTRRATHVEPTDDGVVWQCDLRPSGGSIHYFFRRDGALAFERLWLEEHGLPWPEETR
jgi:hypothetical protein